MKRNLFLWAAFAVMMALAGCTQKEIVYVEKEDGTDLLPGEGVLTISLSGTTTRAARPIDHFDPSTALTSGGNNVNKIGFRIYHGEGDALKLDNDVKITAYSSVNGDLPESDNVTENNILNNYVLNFSSFTNGGEVKIKLDGLSTGVYHIVAYGYNSDSNTFPYNLTNQLEEVEGDGSEPEYKDIVGLKCEMGGELFPEEIFAGAIKANVNEYQLFTQVNTLTLERQVAGMLVYLKNVPTHVLNKQVGKITISTFVKATDLYFPYTYRMGQSYNPAHNTNGTYAQTNLLTFTFNENNTTNFSNPMNGDSYRFSRDSNGNEDTDAKSFLLADEIDSDVKQYLDDNIECKSNTLFGSCFILPFPSSDTYREDWGYEWNSLNIVYWDTAGKIIKVAPLKDSNASNVGGYSIERNHFYSIGTKRTTDIPSPDDPEDPDDDPLDISDVTGYDYFVLTIDDGWDGNYDLEK